MDHTSSEKRSHYSNILNNIHGLSYPCVKTSAYYDVFRYHRSCYFNSVCCLMLNVCTILLERGLFEASVASHPRRQNSHYITTTQHAHKSKGYCGIGIYMYMPPLCMAIVEHFLHSLHSWGNAQPSKRVYTVTLLAECTGYDGMKNKSFLCSHTVSITALNAVG